MKDKIKILLASLFASASLFAFAGCSSDSEVDDSKVGDKLEEAADEVKDATKDAVEEAKEVVEEVADDVKDATN